MALAAFSGLRKSEIQGLRREDLKDEELYVRRSAWRPTHVVEQTKTQASKAPVPVVPILAKYLKAHRNGSTSEGFIFAGPLKKKPLDLRNLAKRMIRPALDKAKIPWSGWHGFRRGLATTLYELGARQRRRDGAVLHEARFQGLEGGYGESREGVQCQVEQAARKKGH